MTSLLPTPAQQWLDQNGLPLAGGLIYTYIVNSTTPKTTWQDPGMVAPNANPVVADAEGRTLIYGTGTYRVRVTDALGNLIADDQSAATLADDVISAVMLPVVGASTLQEAMDLMGVTAAIDAALAAINLITGPTGPVSTTPGPTGPTGATGAVGAGSTTLQKTNPGFFKDNTTGFIVQFGFATTPASGQSVVFFPTAFTTSNIFLAGSTSGGGSPTTGSTGGWWVNFVMLNDNSGFNVATSSPFLGGNYLGGPMGFWWIAVGW